MDNRKSNGYGFVYDQLHWQAFKAEMTEMMDKRDRLEEEFNKLSDKISEKMDEYNEKRNSFIKMVEHMEALKQ